jgi:hypothetical protein
MLTVVSSLSMPPCRRLSSGFISGTITMLSVDQFLRLICLPVIVTALMVASHFSGVVSPRPAALEMDRK